MPKRTVILVALVATAACGAEPPPVQTTPPPPEQDDASALQNYISIYATHPEHTPRAMIRLADIWGREALDSCRQRNRLPCDGLGQALNIATRLPRDFPDSELADDAILRIGTWQIEAGRIDRGMAALLHLICAEMSPDPFAAAPDDLQTEGDGQPLAECSPRWANSDVLAQAWMRVSEQLFDGWTGHSTILRVEPEERDLEPDSEALPFAVVAFRRTVQLVRDPAERDEANLGLAWSLYLLTKWKDAFEVAAPLLANEHVGVDARTIAVRAALEADWNGDTAPDERRGVSRPEIAALVQTGGSHAQDLVVAIAEGLAQAGDDAAGDAFTLFVETWPDHPFTTTACAQLPRNRTCRRLRRGR